MSKKIHDFNDIIRKLRKKLFGKGPERIHTIFVQNMAISTLYGNLTPAEQFIARTTEGKETVHMARTKLIQNLYASSPPEGQSLIPSQTYLSRIHDLSLHINLPPVQSNDGFIALLSHKL